MRRMAKIQGVTRCEQEDCVDNSSVFRTWKYCTRSEIFLKITKEGKIRCASFRPENQPAKNKRHGGFSGHLDAHGFFKE